ncbi:type II toxin-antitoxin system antitoxin VapB [Caminibacter pacificus]
METTKIFTSGNSQAVRLPKKYRFKNKEAYISKIGDAVVIFPKKSGWKSLFESIDKFTNDFFQERAQPKIENRENLFK